MPSLPWDLIVPLAVLYCTVVLLMVETFSRVISRAILKFTPGGPPWGQQRAPFGQRRHQ
jgi:hypothetical protein